ncbi:MAG: hypothetical protein R3C03_21150 [Pirellulaceae bacterium]
MNTGPESGVFKSTDGGETWRELTSGLPGGDKGKIALGVSPQHNNVVYASVETVNRLGGFYRSEDFGESWEQMSDFVSGGTGPHYYQEIFLDPHRFDVIYHANNTLVRSEDGGKTFEPVEGEFKHVDNHAVVFHPTDPDFVLVGCDGGVYRSFDYTGTWQFFANLPVTQYYKIDVDYDLPFYHVVGGTQDNFSHYGPTATRNVKGITNSDWRVTIGGDGHDNAIDYEDPDTVYCESQQGFIRRFDRKTGESIDVRPQPAAGEDSFRFNWDSPILVSPHNHERIYFGSQKLHCSNDRGDSWTTISPDLSKNIDRWTLPIMGRVWGIDAGFDLFAMSQYGNITSISESPVVEGLIYVGTDDGLVQVTEDGGANWRKVERFFDVPEGAFVNDIKADRHDADTVYVCLDHHKTGDYSPYVLKSTDRGRTWKSIASDLPERHLVWRLEQDHMAANLLFLGTEYGVFASINGGENWTKLTAGMPTISVRDLAIQKRENDLVAATFGRGIYVLDDYSALREMSQTTARKSAHLFPVRRSWWYAQDDLIGGVKGFQGDSYFNADNPEYGVTFTVYLKDEVESLKGKRGEAEGKLKEDGKDATIPTLDDLEAEANEIVDERFVEIRTLSGQLVNRVALPGGKGVHRVSWSYNMLPLGGSGISPLAGPGEYLAAVCLRSNGEVKKLTDDVSFTVEQMLEPTIPYGDRAEIIAFQTQANELQFRFTSASRELERANSFVEQAVAAATSNLDAPGLIAELRTWQADYRALIKSISGSSILDERQIEQAPTAIGRLSNALFGSMSNYGPTKTHREQLEIAKGELEALFPEMEAIAERAKALKEKLDAEGLLLDY